MLTNRAVQTYAEPRDKKKTNKNVGPLQGLGPSGAFGARAC